MHISRNFNTQLLTLFAESVGTAVPDDIAENPDVSVSNGTLLVSFIISAIATCVICRLMANIRKKCNIKDDKVFWQKRPNNKIRLSDIMFIAVYIVVCCIAHVIAYMK